MDSESLILDKLCFAYPNQPDHPVFEALSAKIPLSGNTLILGANSSGKTALARILGGLDPPLKGGLIWPEPQEDRNSYGWERPAAGVVFENAHFQFHTFTVKEELGIGLLYRGASPEDGRKALQEAADKLGMAPYMDCSIQELNQKEQLAVLVASFMLLKPRMLVLDFSLSGLDRWFRGLLLNLCEEGPALVVISRMAQDLAFVGSGSRAFILEQGSLLPLSTPLDDPELILRLASSGIRLPWYAPLAAALRRKGLLSGLFYEQEEEFSQAVKKLAQTGKS
ncbi:MAG TPA: ATP-binding cassette domain-containing protein [archaeon]|nr:ATP-binding cassette domain-containing protein [archaeon]